MKYTIEQLEMFAEKAEEVAGWYEGGDMPLAIRCLSEIFEAGYKQAEKDIRLATGPG